MRVIVFKDRCGRVIRIAFDEDCTRAVAYHHDEPVGELRISIDDDSANTVSTLLNVCVEPAYRRSGIAHTLLVYASREIGQPIRVDLAASPDSFAFETLCRCLAGEGILIQA
ncbi:GNAT family N-acetyltransferase [Paraburkholderia terrae]|uniref:GNAT family N-acetyltransferase n=1 Tax=Paraburkholderia terrae TaxID=311230 RepID=UPI00296B1348|nr:GNAT family N-acetyltransferase [Paraburkholderia terrae]MDW3663101.1 GNAT family N-acetyltransferase [Paraburkholderia terrae]